MKRFSIVLVCAAVALAAIWWWLQPRATSETVPPERRVRLANRQIEIAAEKRFPSGFAEHQTPTRRGTVPYVLVCAEKPGREVRAMAESCGARVVGFLAANAMLVEVDEAALGKLRGNVSFEGASEYVPGDKIHPQLLADKSERIETTLLLLNGIDEAEVVAAIEAGGGTILHPTPAKGMTVSAELPRELVKTLAGKAEVKWLERYARMKLHNDVAVRPGLMNVTPMWEKGGLTGAGEIISTSDTGIDTGSLSTLHPDLTNAVIGISKAYSDCDLFDRIGHGTHTAGSIIGDGTLSGGQIRGTAPGAKLWVWACYIYYDEDHQGLCIPENVSELFRPKGIDAHLHSASWGSVSSYGEYTTSCVGYDQYVWEHSDFLPVFSAGNEGDSGTTFHIAKTIPPPGTSKNVLTVGACENNRANYHPHIQGDPTRIVYFSSCGPCADGRIKPDLVAPGSFILSPLSTRAERCQWDDGSYERYQFMSGTSMSCPLTAGAAALVREWARNVHSLTNPSAALVKAVLMCGTRDLYESPTSDVLSNIPDTRQGWGSVDLERSLAPTNGESIYLCDRLPFVAGLDFVFTVTTTNVAPLAAQLVWIDCAGEPAAAKALVNDFDLSVTTGGTFKACLINNSDAVDTLNTAESARMASAPATTYEISVACPTVWKDHTEGGAVALVLRGAFDPGTVTVETKGKDLATLTVLEPTGANHGISQPAVGILEQVVGSTATLSAADGYVTDAVGYDTTRYRCLGWTDGTGDIPPTGTNSFLEITITQSSTIRWVWEQIPDYSVYTEAWLYHSWWGWSFYSDAVFDIWCPSGSVYAIMMPAGSPIGAETYGDYRYGDVTI